MPTQIAPTPIVKGEDAKVILREMRRKPTPAAKRGAEMLAAKYEKMIKASDY